MVERIVVFPCHFVREHFSKILYWLEEMEFMVLLFEYWIWLQGTVSLCFYHFGVIESKCFNMF